MESLLFVGRGGDVVESLEKVHSVLHFCLCIFERTNQSSFIYRGLAYSSRRLLCSTSNTNNTIMQMHFLKSQKYLKK